jgi:hypothetical protein
MAATRINGQDVRDAAVQTADLADSAVTFGKLSVAADPGLEDAGGGALRVKADATRAVSITSAGVGVACDENSFSYAGNQLSFNGLRTTTNDSTGGADLGRLYVADSGAGTAACRLRVLTNVPATLGGIVYVGNESAAVANTTTETTFSTGSYTIPADAMQTKTCIRVTAGGRHSSTGTPSVNFRLKLGTNSVISVGPTNTLNNATNRAWRFEALMFITSTGASGVVKGNGHQTLNTGTDAFAMRGNGVAVDTTIARDVALTVQWGAASASNTITLESFVVEIFGGQP